MSKTKKIAILAIIAMVLTLMPTALFAATADSDRLSGDNRIATALDIASAGTWGTSVVLAPADDANLVDALAAAPLAGQENAPILLTFKGSLDANVKAKIVALGATKVYVVGAISDAVAAEVDAINGVTVEALKGAGRQATAVAVNAKLTVPAGTFVVGYDAIPDALSVASFAAKNKYAIVLANQDGSVDPGTLVGATKYIVGGATKVKDITGVTRLSGADRYATNSDVASKLGFTYDRVYVANGVSLVDALAVAPLAAKYGAFVALASGSDVAAKSVVNTKLSATSKVIAVGGTTAVPAAVVGKVAYSATKLEVASVTYLNAKQIEVVFTATPDKDSAQDESLYFVKRAQDATNQAVGTLDGTAVASLQSDNKTVIITLTTSVSTNLSVNADAPFNFIVDGVKDGAGVAAPKYTTTLLNTDKVAPTVVSVSAKATTTTKTVTIAFSEPVNVNTGIVKVNGKIATLAAGAKAREVVATTQDLLSVDSSYSVSIDSIKDVAGNLISPNPYTSTLTVVKDANVDGVKSITVDGDDTIKIEFGEKMDAATITTGNITVTDPNGGAVSNYAINPKAGDTTGTLFNITFATNTNLYANKDSVSVNVTLTDRVKDNTGNKIAPTVYALSLTKDTTAPTITKAEVVGAGGKYDGATYAAGALVVTFSEAIVRPADGGAGQVTRSKVSLVNQDGLDFTAAVYTATPIVGAVLKTNDATRLVIPFVVAPATTVKKATVRFDSKGFTDESVGSNGSAAATMLDVDFENAPTGSDTTKPEVTVAPAVTGTNDIGYTLTEVNLDKASALDINNYRLDGAPLPTGSYVTLSATSPYTVTVIIPAANIAKSQNYTFVISGIKDKSGNIMDTYAANNIALVDDTKPVLQSGKINTDGSTTLTFSESVTGTVDGDLVVKLNDVILNVAQYNVSAITDGADKGGVLVKIVAAFDSGIVPAVSTGDERIYIDMDNSGTYNSGDISLRTGSLAAASDYNGGFADDTDISTLIIKTLLTGNSTGTDAATNVFANDKSVTIK